MSLGDLAIGFGLFMFSACGAVLLLWYSDPLRGPDGEERP